MEKFKEISLKFRLISFVRNERRKRDLFYNCKKEKMKPSRGPGVLSQLVLRLKSFFNCGAVIENLEVGSWKM